MKTRTMQILVLAVAAVCSTTAGATDWEMSWYSIDGGGSMMAAGGSMELGGTTGQIDAGLAMSGGSFDMAGGFWSVAVGFITGSLHGDCDEDGDVDLQDQIGLVDCLTGPAVGPTEGCACYDLGADGTVDLLDVADFLVMFTGE